MTQQLLQDLWFCPVSLRQLFVARLIVTLCILLTLGLFFRFVNIDQKVFWYDETRTSILLTPQVKLQLPSTPNASQVTRNFQENYEIFFYNPDDFFRQDLIEAGYQFNAVQALGHLWRLEKQLS